MSDKVNLYDSWSPQENMIDWVSKFEKVCSKLTEIRSK